MKIDKNTAIIFDKGGKNVFLNFDKVVGRVLIKKVSEIMDIIRKDEVSKD